MNAPPVRPFRQGFLVLLVNKGMNAFEQSVKDIFSVPDFLEEVQIGGELYRCIVSSLLQEEIFTEIGTERKTGFTISLKLPLDREPKISDRVRFRDTAYRI